jgi:type II secretory pathway pseudopilin PulG
MNFTTAPETKSIQKIGSKGLLDSRRGFNIVEFLIFVAVIVLVAVVVIPNFNLLFGKQTLIDQANVEAASVRAAANSYEINTGKYPANSDALWSNPPGPSDYIAQPRAFYTFDVGTGRITAVATNNEPNLPANAWNGITWNPNSDCWVKQ